MNRRLWLVPVLIVAINALAIVVCWRCLEEVLPAHFDLDGNPDGTMPAFMLAEPVVLLASVVGFAICAIKSRKHKQ